MHRSVENAVPLIRHPVRDASSSRRLAESAEREERIGVEAYFWLSQALFHSSLAAFGGIGRYVGLFLVPGARSLGLVHRSVKTCQILRQALSIP